MDERSFEEKIERERERNENLTIEKDSRLKKGNKNI